MHCLLYSSLLSVFFALVVYSDPIILAPKQNATLLTIGLIYFPGTQILPENYVKSLLNLQTNFTTANLWISIPEFINDFPSQDQINDLVAQSLKSFQKYGFKFTKQTPIFMAAHSLSGNHATLFFQF